MRIAFVTAPAGEAESLARRAVDSGLAACVNIVPGLTSVYRWKGEVLTDAESLLIAKLSEEHVDDFVAAIQSWHSYDCPECLLLEVAGGNPDYLAWVEASGFEA